MSRARMCPQARVSWAYWSYGWGCGIPARLVSNTARTRLSTPGSSGRISVPLYGICRVRAPCARIRCAARMASRRGSGQVKPGQLGGGQGDELDPERLDEA
jgi:hypothetical protein